VLGLFVFSRNPRHPANMLFLLGMADLAIIEAGYAMVLLSNSEWQTALTGMRLAVRGEAALPVVWLLFSIVFVRGNYKEILSKWAPAFLGMVVVSLFFIVWAGSPSFMTAQSSGVFNLGPMGRYFHIYLLLGVVLNLINLENTLRSTSVTQRKQIKYIVFGIGSILAFFIYLSSQALLLSILNIQVVLLISFVILISVSTMALSIAKYKLLSTDIYISRYVIYNSVTVLIVGLYLLAVGIITYGIRYFHIPSNYFFATLFVFISILALAILLNIGKFRRKVLLFINRHFYKHKYDFREKWMETIERISSKRTIEEIRLTLREMVSENMGARIVYIWLYDPITKSYHATREGLKEDYKRITPLHPLLNHIKNIKGPFMIDGSRENESSLGINDDAIRDMAIKTDTVLCAPLMVGEEVVGFMLQGKDFTGETYIENDFEYLKTLATQAAMQIKNIRLTQDLMIAKEIDTFNKMSSFIMHDLKNLTNSLSLVSENAKYNMDNPEFQRDAIMTIEKTVARMKGLIKKLPSAPTVIELKREKVELGGLVHRAVKKISFSKTKNLTITEEINGVPPVCVDPEAMEMVLFNILKNASEAILENGIIKIQAVVDGQNVGIIIDDNGVGMSKYFMEKDLFQPFKTTKKDGFGIGLYHCKTVVEAHGGEINVVSTEGKGTTFTIRLPIV
jgi:hypothetical protein